MSREPLPGLPGGKPIDARAAERDAADKGRVVEYGWLGLRAVWISDQASAGQIEDMRNAFFAGAAHVFGCMTGGMLDGGTTETPGDKVGPEVVGRVLRRMDLLLMELTKFHADFQRKKQQRPSAHIAAAIAGHDSDMVSAMDQIDRALRGLMEARGNLTAADLAMALTFPLLHVARYSEEAGARAAIDAVRVALDAIEESVAKRHPPKGPPQ